MQVLESEISGPLQAKILMMLKDDALCGKDIMERLKIRSPGTIYPVLEELRRKRLVDFRTETEGAVRRKRYALTETGKQQLKENLVRSARMFCCDASLHIKRLLDEVKELVEIKPRQKILCTLEYEEVKRLLGDANVTFSYDLEVPSNTYDLVLSFLGVGCLIGKEPLDITKYVNRLHQTLKKGGSLLTIEIEKTDNLFARIFFEDIAGFKESPGLRRDDLKSILEESGFKDTRVISRSGLLYAVSHK